MARLKNTPEQTGTVEVIENQTGTVEVIENQTEGILDTKDAELELNEAESSERQSSEEQTKEELPKHILRIMEIFYYMDELYISKHGGVFPSNTKESLVKEAKLYKNPYFKK